MAQLTGRMPTATPQLSLTATCSVDSAIVASESTAAPNPNELGLGNTNRAIGANGPAADPTIAMLPPVAIDDVQHAIEESQFTSNAGVNALVLSTNTNEQKQVTLLLPLELPDDKPPLPALPAGGADNHVVAIMRPAAGRLVSVEGAAVPDPLKTFFSPKATAGAASTTDGTPELEFDSPELSAKDIKDAVKKMAKALGDLSADVRILTEVVKKGHTENDTHALKAAEERNEIATKAAGERNEIATKATEERNRIAAENEEKLRLASEERNEIATKATEERNRIAAENEEKLRLASEENRELHRVAVAERAVHANSARVDAKKTRAEASAANRAHLAKLHILEVKNNAFLEQHNALDDEINDFKNQIALLNLQNDATEEAVAAIEEKMIAAIEANKQDKMNVMDALIQSFKTGFSNVVNDIAGAVKESKVMDAKIAN